MTWAFHIYPGKAGTPFQDPSGWMRDTSSMEGFKQRETTLLAC